MHGLKLRSLPHAPAHKNVRIVGARTPRVNTQVFQFGIGVWDILHAARRTLSSMKNKWQYTIHGAQKDEGGGGENQRGEWVNRSEFSSRCVAWDSLRRGGEQQTEAACG